MPPKPWEKRQVDSNLSASISMNSSPTEALPLVSGTGAQIGPEPATTGTTAATTGLPTSLMASTSAMGTTGLGTSSMYGNSMMGSSQGGYGSSLGGYGGYGSSYGGYGGYGSSMYGGYGGGMYGGMGMNRLGMMGGDPNQPGFLQSGMMYMQSFSIVLQSLGEIARTMEMNAQGLTHLWMSTSNLFTRIRGWGVSFVEFIKNTVRKIAEKIINFLKNRGHFLSTDVNMSSKDQVKQKINFYSTAIKFAFVIFVLSMLPLMKNMIIQDSKEAVFSTLQKAI